MMSLKSMKLFKYIFISAFISNAAFAADVTEQNLELPEPLSFNAALAFAEKQYHYSFQLNNSAIKVAEAKSLAQQSSDDLSVDLKGYLRKVGVSEVGDPENDNDSKVSLIAKKKLYDFGLTDKQNKFNDSAVLIKQLEFELKKEQYLLKVVESYFNVLKADNEYLTHNENMSIAFIRFNRAQEHQELGITSDLDILKAQSNYELVRQQRYLSESNQRFTRQVLSELLGSSNLPDQLEIPVFNDQKIIIDDVDLLIDLAFKNSKEMRWQQARLMQSQQAIKVASNTFSPVIEAELEVTDYQRVSAFRDDWRASINFNIPLYAGDKQNSGVKLAQANHLQTLANIKQVESNTRLKVLELWQTIKEKILELEGAKIKQEYRDLYLEQSRANYELEYKSDLGDSMVQFSKSRAERYQIEFDLESAWRQLTQLVGHNNQSQLIKSDVK